MTYKLGYAPIFTGSSDTDRPVGFGYDPNRGEPAKVADVSGASITNGPTSDDSAQVAEALKYLDLPKDGELSPIKFGGLEQYGLQYDPVSKTFKAGDKTISYQVSPYLQNFPGSWMEQLPSGFMGDSEPAPVWGGLTDKTLSEALNKYMMTGGGKLAPVDSIIDNQKLLTGKYDPTKLVNTPLESALYGNKPYFYEDLGFNSDSTQAKPESLWSIYDTPHTSAGSDVQSQWVQANEQVVRSLVKNMMPGVSEDVIDQAAVAAFNEHKQRFNQPYNHASSPIAIAQRITQLAGGETPQTLAYLEQVRPQIDAMTAKFDKAYYKEKKAEKYDWVAPVAMIASMAFPGMGAALGSALGASTTMAPIVGNALISGTTSALTGGDFLRGAAMGGLGAYGGSLLPTQLADIGIPKAVAPYVSNAVVGGLSSALQGGDVGEGVIGGLANSAIGGALSKVSSELRNLGLTPAQIKSAITLGVDFLKNEGKVSPQTLIKAGAILAQ